MNNAYHGDTLGATSVGGLDLFHATYRDLLFDTIPISYPYPYRFEGTIEECAQHSIGGLKEVLGPLVAVEDVLPACPELFRRVAGVGVERCLRHVCSPVGVKWIASRHVWIIRSPPAYVKANPLKKKKKQKNVQCT